MDSNNWRPTQPDPAMEGAGGGGDWRSQLPPDSRQRIVNKLMDTLKRHLPFSGQEGLQELKMSAVRLEEETYTAATSQSDYLRKISLKMLTMESRSQNTMPSALPPNSASMSRNPQDSGIQELKMSAVKLEEETYTAETSQLQSDYLRKISLKMLTMESRSQNTMPSALPPNSASMSRNPQDSD